MSLSGIFDPLVRAWFEENGSSAGSGGGSGGGNVIEFHGYYSEAMEQLPTFDLAVIGAGTAFRVSEKILTTDELEGGFFLFSIRGADYEMLGFRLKADEDPSHIYVDPDVGLIGIMQDSRTFALILPEETAQLLREALGVEISSGTYFTADALGGSEGAALIYGI